jgi:hypothetical protein
LNQKKTRSTSIPRPIETQTKEKLNTSKQALDKIIKNVNTPDRFNNSLGQSSNFSYTFGNVPARSKPVKPKSLTPRRVNPNQLTSSPLVHTPTHLRNNSNRNDLFGINPLPNINSPYLSAREYAPPNLESWGVTNQAETDSFLNFRNSVSPLLPMYKLTNKPRKVYC